MMTMFVGIISVKPSQDFTRPLRMPKGLKGLLNMLNVTVHHTNEGFILLLFSFICCFVLLID